MSFFILVFIAHALVNFYLFLKGWKALPDTKKARTIYSVIFFLVFMSFMAAMLWRNHLPLPVLKPLYFLGTSWMGVMLYLTFYYVVTDIIKLLDKALHFLPCAWTAKPKTYPRIQVASGSILLTSLLLYGYIQFCNVKVVEQDIVIHKAAGDHKELRVVGFSDMHLGVSVDKVNLARYVELINKQKPDVIIIAGDLIDNNLRPLNEERMWEELNQLEAPLGIYLCLGNHEYLSGIQESLSFLRKTKLNVLVDEARLVDNSFYIIGRDDEIDRKRKPLSTLLNDVDKSLPLILLDHQPHHLEQAQQNGIDLQLSGHTHNGQLFPLNLVVKRMYELAYGYLQKGDTHYYVSSGIALWGPQFRIGTQSEIVVFNIRFN